MYTYEHQLMIWKAVMGDGEAQYKLAILYCMRENLDAATYWLQCAADQNHLYAIQFLYALQNKNFIQIPYSTQH